MTEERPTRSRKKPAGAVSSEDRLLAIATQEFALHGFDGVPIRKIAQAAGLTLPTIYHFFDDKRALYRRVCSIAFACQNVRLAQSLLEFDDPAVRLLHFTSTLVTILRDETHFSLLLQRELVERDYSLIEEQVSAGLAPHFSMVTRAVSDLEAGAEVDDKSIAIYSLAFGLTQLGPVWKQLGTTELGTVGPADRSTEDLTILILHLVFPEIDWRAVAERRLAR